MGFDREALFPILKAASTISVGIFAGGAIYINVVEHPSRMAMDTKNCHKQWKESFDRARVFQGRMALLSAVTAVGAYYCKPSKGLTFLLGGCTMALIFPYTLFVLKPASIDPIYADYDKLVARESEEFVRDTVDKWNKYHAVRSVISFTVLVEFVAQIIHETPFF
jgi:hypothetical protein